jgi:hypothetical protein
VNELSTTEVDWRVIQQRIAAIAEMEWLRAHSLQVLDQSSELLRMIDQINGPLINASSGNERPRHVRFTPESGHRNRPAYYLRRISSGSLAKFAAIRRTTTVAVGKPDGCRLVPTLNACDPLP